MKRAPLIIAAIAAIGLVAVVRSSAPLPAAQAGQAPSPAPSSAAATTQPIPSPGDAPGASDSLVGGGSVDATPSSDPFRFHAIPRDLLPDPEQIPPGASSKDVVCEGRDPCGP